MYLVSLLFAPPILHPTNHFLDREVCDYLHYYYYYYYYYYFLCIYFLQ